MVRHIVFVEYDGRTFGCLFGGAGRRQEDETGCEELFFHGCLVKWKTR